MLEKAIGISQVDEESKKQAKILKDETTTTQSMMAIMKDKEQNTLKRHRSEETVRGQHRCRNSGTLYKWAECTQIDNTVQPIICPSRNIPVALRERFSREN